MVKNRRLCQCYGHDSQIKHICYAIIPKPILNVNYQDIIQEYSQSKSQLNSELLNHDDSIFFEKSSGRQRTVRPPKSIHPLGPRDLDCRSCPTGSAQPFHFSESEKKKLPRPLKLWRLGYGNDTIPHPKTNIKPKLSQIERPGGYTVITKIKDVTDTFSTDELNCLTCTGNLFIIDPFKHESTHTHYTCDKINCGNGEIIKKTPFTIKHQSTKLQNRKNSSNEILYVSYQGSLSYDQYLRKRGFSFVCNLTNNSCDNYCPELCTQNCEPKFIYKPNNAQFAHQGAVSASSRLARLKQQTKSNNGLNYLAHHYKNPHKDIKKNRQVHVLSKHEICYRKGQHTKCFKTIMPYRRNDQHKRFKRPLGRNNFYVEISDLEPEEKECKIKYKKISNDTSCVNTKSNSDYFITGNCKITTTVKDIFRIDVYRDPGVEALTRVRRRRKNKCVNRCTRKRFIRREIINVKKDPLIFPPMVGPPTIDCYKPPLVGPPNVTICSPPLVGPPQNDCYMPPLVGPPKINICAPPLVGPPNITCHKPPLVGPPNINCPPDIDIGDCITINADTSNSDPLNIDPFNSQGFVSINL